MKIITIILSLFLTSCMISAKQYAGPDRPAHELATLNNPDLSTPVQIFEINGKSRGMGYVEKFELLPGEVSIAAQYSPPSTPVPGKIDLECGLSFVPLSFTAKANTKYQLAYVFDSTTVTVWIKESASNKIVSEKQTVKNKTKSGKYLVDLGIK